MKYDDKWPFCLQVDKIMEPAIARLFAVTYEMNIFVTIRRG